MFWEKVLARLSYLKSDYILSHFIQRRLPLCYIELCCAVLSRSVMSSSLRPHGLGPARLLCPWDFPGKNIGMGCHARAKMNEIADALKAKGVRVKVDDRDNVRAGFKFAEYELKGVPVRLALGQRDLANGTIELARRDTLTKETVSQEGLIDYIVNLLDEQQKNIFKKALDYRNSMITKVDTWDEFVDVLNNKGGFISAHWDGTPETEQAIKEATKATIRCIPLDVEPEEGKCIFTGKPSPYRVLFAKSY